MKTQPLDYRDGSTALRGHLVYDDTLRGKRPGVVLMPDLWGLGPHIKRQAGRVAALGYVALAGDPYGGGVEFDSMDEARKVAQALRGDVMRVRQRTRAALEALAQLPMVDGDRLGAIGYCMGGSFALELARSGARIRGVATFHAGLVTTQPAKAGEVTAKALVCTGADDPHVPWDQVKGFVDEMRAAGVDYQVNVYGGAQHGFAVPEASSRGISGVAYDTKADSRSWAAMRHFYEEVFGQ